MKSIYVLASFATILLFAACQSEKTSDADSSAAEQTAGAASTETASEPLATQQGSSTILPPKPAEDMMFMDLEQGAKGLVYYRGHPFSGSVWMNFERVYSCTFADGVATSYTFYHSGGHVAALCSAKGKVQQCFDYEGIVLAPDSFARRYPDMQRFISSTFVDHISAAEK